MNAASGFAVSFGGVHPVHRPAAGGKVALPDDAVSCHCDNLARRLVCAHDAKLVGGGNAGVNRDAHAPRGKLRIGQRVQLRTREHAVPRAGDAYVPGNGQRCFLVISGDHHRLDAGLAAPLYGGTHLGPGRVQHAHQAQEAQLFLPGGGGAAFREAQHAQRFARHAGTGGVDIGAVPRGQQPRTCGGFDMRTAGQQHIGRALAQQAYAAGTAHGHAHAFACGVEWVFAYDGILLQQRLFCYAGLGGGHQHGNLGRVAHHVVDVFGAGDVRGGAQGGGLAQPPQCRVPRGLYGTAVFLHGALRPVTAARDVQCAPGHPDALYRHFVLRDGAGFVCADNACAAQCFHSVQLADDGAAPQDAVDAERQRDGYDGGQALGDGGYGEGDACEKHLQKIVALQKAQEADGQTDGDAGHGHEPSQLFELELQGGGLLAGGFHHPGDLSHLGLHAGGRHHAFAPARHHDAAHVQSVSGLLCGGKALAREHGLVARYLHTGLQRAVRRYLIAGLEQQHVAGHHGTRADLQFPAAAAHARRGRRKLFQCFQRFFRAVFLQKAHGGVHQHDDYNGNGFRALAHQHRDERGRRQDQDHQVLELREEHGGHAGSLFPAQAVFAHFRKAGFCLGFGQARRCVLQHAFLPFFDLGKEAHDC